MSTRDVVRVTLAVAATIAGLWVLWRVRHVLMLVGIGAFLAIAFEPAVSFLQRFVKSRAGAVALMTVITLVFIAIFVASVAPPIATQAQNLADNLPRYAEDIKDSSTVLGALERRFAITDRLESLIGNASSALGTIGTILSVLSDFLVVLALTFYFLVNAPRMKREGLKLIPLGKRKRTAALVEVVFDRVGGWMEGNVLISVVAGVVSFLALWIIGVPYPAALAMWVAITDLIPMVGAMIGALVCTVVAFFVSVPVGLVTLAFFLAYQQIENYVISPRVMRRTVDVSAVAVIIAALVGGTLLGPVGVLLAVPAAASLKVVAQELMPAER